MVKLKSGVDKLDIDKLSNPRNLKNLKPDVDKIAVDKIKADATNVVEEKRLRNVAENDVVRQCTRN